ncbi:MULTISPECIES: DUF3054 domain-containing protein [unclassified Mycobacterium]|uniref:DUF3054 domain-containing protein n=1 Tax=unclassified Mycobacterium TaxID=2642494 RepID=UPI00074001AE|nr:MULTISPECIES: DUF3054 domain-containing protein [unclassified Mycobacterium]KUH82310.1 hypothetical protein AU185_21780 [Mycobacterium sp. GA-0227b]KUH90168.1 hypothetical protein AU186_10920 [Mycobacterium sp. GA-1999]KUH95048.1 hypothetical protein AU187_15735 [Mycobacterium sp. IS-1556]
MPIDSREQTRPALAALATDVCCLIVFAAIGRRSHAEGVDLAGVAATAWPFVAGAAAGWALTRGWRRPYALLPTGIAVWVCTIVVGMLLRKLTTAGVAPSFVVVASISTAVLLLGWRAAILVMTRR